MSLSDRLVAIVAERKVERGPVHRQGKARCFRNATACPSYSDRIGSRRRRGSNRDGKQTRTSWLQAFCEKEALAPAGNPGAEKEIGSGDPETRLAVMVLAAEDPWVADRLIELESEKLKGPLLPSS